MMYRFALPYRRYLLLIDSNIAIVMVIADIDIVIVIVIVIVQAITNTGCIIIITICLGISGMSSDIPNTYSFLPSSYQYGSFSWKEAYPTYRVL